MDRFNYFFNNIIVKILFMLFFLYIKRKLVKEKIFEFLLYIDRIFFY